MENNNWNNYNVQQTANAPLPPNNPQFVPAGNIPPQKKQNKLTVPMIIVSVLAAVALVSAGILGIAWLSDKRYIAAQKNIIEEQQDSILEQEETIKTKSEEYLALNEKYQSLQENYDFYYKFAACVDENNNYYHHYGCDYFDDSSFWIYNINAADEKGYKPCPHCWND